MHAEHGLEQLGAAGAHQSVEADNLAGARPRTTRRRRRCGPAAPGRGGPSPTAASGPSAADAGVRAARRVRPVIRSTIHRTSTSLVVAPHRPRAVAKHRDDVGDRAAALRADARCRRSATPCAARSRMSSEEHGNLGGRSAEVGSSIISTRTSRTSARAISTICCWPSGSVPSRVSRIDGLPELREHLTRARRSPSAGRASPSACSARGRRTDSRRPSGPERAAAPGG